MRPARECGACARACYGTAHEIPRGSGYETLRSGTLAHGPVGIHARQINACAFDGSVLAFRFVLRTLQTRHVVE